MQATRIILIRHGETSWNTETRIHGHTDIDLNARGRWPAQRLAASLVHETPQATHSSDLPPATPTAFAVAQTTGP